jgi:hypothetical protein
VTLFLTKVDQFLARLYKVYEELFYSPWRRRLRPRPNFILKFWCCKIFFTITFSFLGVSTSNFKYMFLIINRILCDKVYSSSTNIARVISPLTYIVLLEKCYFYYNFISCKDNYFKSSTLCDKFRNS